MAELCVEQHIAPSSRPHFRTERIGSDSGKAASYWPVIDALTTARETYGLRPASLVVLKALCSFLPKDLVLGDEPLLVWPSNATLIERASGIPERSLRRHLDRLVEAGLIQRKSSNNGKRFALRLRHAVIDAFGFDLSPLFRRQDEILAAAEDITLRDDLIASLRCKIRIALHHRQSSTLALSAEEEADVLRLLRRKAEISELREMLALLAEDMNAIAALPQTVSPQAMKAEDLAATNSQNDRHILNTNKESIHSVLANPTEADLEDQPLKHCLEQLAPTLDFASEKIDNWSKLHRLADHLSPMLGIKDALLQSAKRKMGAEASSLTLLCLVQLTGKLNKPAAYFQRLIQRAEAGSFSLKGLLHSADLFARKSVYS